MRLGTSSSALLAVALALASGPARAEPQCPAGASGPPTERATLAVVGNGEVSRPPEIATLDISVLTRSPTLDATVRDHRARAAQAGAALERLKAGGVTVDQGSFTLSEERAPVPVGVRPSDQPPTYRAATRYDLTVEPLDRLDAAVAAVVASGLFEVGSVQFSVADPNAALDDARRAAVADARRQALVYAEAGGVRLDAIDHIVDGQAASRGDGAYDLPVRLARTASVGIVPPRRLAFTGSVTITWHIVSLPGSVPPVPPPVPR